MDSNDDGLLVELPYRSPISAPRRNISGEQTIWVPGTAGEQQHGCRSCH